MFAPAGAWQTAISQPPEPQHFTIHIESVPAYTPKGVSVYIAGNFNGWNPQDPRYQLASDDHGGYVIMLPDSVKGPIEFKFTLGSWDAVETDNGGNDIENRSAVAGPNRGVYVARVAGWRDPAKKKVKAHTARPTVSVVSDSFAIPQLKRNRRVWIYLPAEYSTSSSRYPVLYMHDGQNLFDDFTSFVGEWGIDETLDSLHAKVIVVAVDHGGDKRFDEYSPWKNAKYGGGEGDEYVEFLVKTLKPYIDSHYRTLRDRKNTAIAGSSMGGLISLYAIAKYPNVFSKAGIFSPAFWVAPQEYDFVRKAKRLPSDTKLYFVMSGQEAQNAEENAGYVRDEQRMVNLLLSRGLKMGTNIVSRVTPDGRHSEWFWRREFPAAFLWLFSPPLDVIGREEIEVYKALGVEADFPLADMSAPEQSTGVGDCRANLKDAEVCSKYDAAFANFLERNREWTVHPREIAPALSRKFVSEIPKPVSSCAEPRAFGLSRIGFDQTRTHAIVRHGAAAGKGPFPLCGWGRSSTVLLEKRKGTWTIDRSYGWVT